MTADTEPDRLAAAALPPLDAAEAGKLRRARIDRIARWALPSAGSKDKRVTLPSCAGEPHGPPFDHSGWTAVLQAPSLTRL